MSGMFGRVQQIVVSVGLQKSVVDKKPLLLFLTVISRKSFVVVEFSAVNLIVS